MDRSELIPLLGILGLVWNQAAKPSSPDKVHGPGFGRAQISIQSSLSFPPEQLANNSIFVCCTVLVLQQKGISQLNRGIICVVEVESCISLLEPMGYGAGRD